MHVIQSLKMIHVFHQIFLGLCSYVLGDWWRKIYSSGHYCLRQQKWRKKVVNLISTNLLETFDWFLVPVFCLSSTFSYIWMSHRWETCDESFVWVGYLCSAARNNLPSPRFSSKPILTKNRVFASMVGLLRRENHNFLTTGWKLAFLNKIWHFFSILPIALKHFAKRYWKTFLKVQTWLYRFFEKQRYKVFNDLWRFVWRTLYFSTNLWHWNAIKGRHRGLRTFYFEHNCFNNVNLGEKLSYKTNMAFLKYPRDVMQVSTLSAQSALRPALVERNENAMSIPYGHLLSCLVPRTDYRSGCR